MLQLVTYSRNFEEPSAYLLQPHRDLSIALKQSCPSSLLGLPPSGNHLAPRINERCCSRSDPQESQNNSIIDHARLNASLHKYDLRLPKRVRVLRHGAFSTGLYWGPDNSTLAILRLTI